MKKGLMPVFAVAVLAISGCMSEKGSTVQEKRAAVRSSRDKIVKEVCDKYPAARRKIINAVGYATFSTRSIHVFLLAAGEGYGMAVDNATGKETFMRMEALGTGVGMGSEDLDLLFVFKDQDTFNKFITSGWEFEGKAGASLKTGGTGANLKGTVAAIDKDKVEIYRITKTGISLEVAAFGEKFWKDKELN